MSDLIQDKVYKIIDYFSKQQLIKTELAYNNQYELLIAVILSAQCLDARVNIVTVPLFKKYRNFKELSQATFEDVFKIIKSISYPKEKARRIIEVAKVINTQYKDIVPNSLNKMIGINGIGRKTANLVLAILYDYPGIAVDTHVSRVSQRLGLVNTTNATKIEQELTMIFPQNVYSKINPWFVIFGRYICKSKKPQCQKCTIYDICIFFKKDSNIKTI